MLTDSYAAEVLCGWLWPVKRGLWERIIRTLERALVFVLVGLKIAEGVMSHTGDRMLEVEEQIGRDVGGSRVEAVDFVAICSGRN